MATGNTPSVSNPNPQVEDSFLALDHLLKETMMLVRQVILEADSRISPELAF